MWVLTTFVGKIVSMSIAIGPVVRQMTRNLYVMVNSCQACCDNLELSADAEFELQFGPELPQFNGQDIWPSLSTIQVVFTEAR